MAEDYLEKANAFLQNRDYFSLGQLPTEASHPATRQLSELAKKDLPQAIELLRQIDFQALIVLKRDYPLLSPLVAAVQDTKAKAGDTLRTIEAGRCPVIAETEDRSDQQQRGRGQQLNP